MPIESAALGAMALIAVPILPFWAWLAQKIGKRIAYLIAHCHLRGAQRGPDSHDRQAGRNYRRGQSCVGGRQAPGDAQLPGYPHPYQQGT